MATALSQPSSTRSFPPAIAPRSVAGPGSGVTRANAAAIARIGQHLVALRETGRRAVAIIDLDCGDGALALAAGRRARMLGFLAITVRGFDRSGVNVRNARRRVVDAVDPAIGYSFETRSDYVTPPIEDDEADIVLVGPERPSSHEIARICATPGAVVRHV